MEAEKVLQREMESLEADIKKRHKDLGMVASGRWIETFDIQVVGLSAKLLAEDYTEYLTQGRGPGRFPPIDPIRKWVEDKGIAALDPSISVSSLAFLIARKIAREGTEYFKQGGTDLLEAVITPQRVQEIIDAVRDVQVDSLLKTINATLSQIKV